MAAGAQPQDLQELAKAGGHASAKRSQTPDAAIVELIQAERLLECFEAELWSNGDDDAGLLATAQAACETSHVPLPDIALPVLAELRSALRTFAAAWIAAPTGNIARLDWA